MTIEFPVDIASNLENVRTNIKKAQTDKEVKLIAVSKFHAADEIRVALESGQRVFGENYVPEAAEKFTSLSQNYPDIELHLIGHLQSNKVKQAIRTFRYIQTLDSENLARKLKKAIDAAKEEDPKFEPPSFYIQLKFDPKEQKTGIDPTAEAVGKLLKYSTEDCGLKVVGLMCIPPENPPEGISVGDYFKKLNELADRFNLERRSMGMSADYEEAIARGATDVRVGSDIFGPRPPDPKSATHSFPVNVL